MKSVALVFVGAMTALAPCLADAQPVAPHAYPARGQSESRQHRDESECASWATRQSGYDPANPPPVTTAKPAPVTGSGARVRGAAVGGLIGGVSGGDAGDAALAGAAVGGVTRRVRNRRQANAENQAMAQQRASVEASWVSARSACLTGRGYTVR